jgi:phospholipid/cholesterol/gamma-HCH transport system ATP-binding protein
MIIETRNITKSFAGKKVLNNINFSVSAGKSLAVIGQSGVGKSVLLKCILGLIKADTGNSFFEGKELSGKHLVYFLNRFGMLFQGAALFDSLPVWENITFRYRYDQTFSNNNRKDLAIEKLKLVGLSENILYTTPAELSGGMQKRVGLARAIASKPEILFFDEPTTGLDPIMAQTINKLIREIVTELGATAITITHDVNSVRTIADDVIMLDKGDIIWRGTIEEFDLSTNPLLNQFISANSNDYNRKIV